MRRNESQIDLAHYRCLIRVADKAKRMWYAREAANLGWNVRALDRQISTLYHERLLASPDRSETATEAEMLIAKDAPHDPRDFIRDPYVLEFLGIPPSAKLYEQEVEQGLIDRLQQFLMELGKGFAFVARQKHLRVEGDEQGAPEDRVRWPKCGFRWR